MSRILLNRTFKCLSVTVPSDDGGNDSVGDVMRAMCSDANGESTQRIVTRLARTIVREGLYKTTAIKTSIQSGGGLLPSNSRLSTRGDSTTSVPDLVHVRAQIEVKLKLDMQDEAEGAAHFRFHVPGVVPPQIVVFVRSGEQMMMMFHGHAKFVRVFTEHLRTQLRCRVYEMNVSGAVMRETLDWMVYHEHDAVELWFGKLNTRGKIGSIIVRIDEEDMVKLGKVATFGQDETPSKVLFDYVSGRTGIDMGRLPLVKVKCGLFTLSIDGRVRFSDRMTAKRRDEQDQGYHNGNDRNITDSDALDVRPSVWWILRRMIENV